MQVRYRVRDPIELVAQASVIIDQHRLLGPDCKDSEVEDFSPGIWPESAGTVDNNLIAGSPFIGTRSPAC